MSEVRLTASEEARARAIDLAPYLAATGWEAAGGGNRFTVWSRQGSDSDLRIVLPSDRNDADAGQRLIEALSVVGYVEGMTFEEALADVEAGGADVVSIRISPSTPSGVAPLDVAERSVSALKEWVVGSAAGVDIGGAVLPPRRARAERYAGRARLTTQPGSFVLTVTMPLYEGRPRADDQTGQMAIEDVVEVQAVPFGRQVASRMRDVAQSAVSLARDVNANRDDITAFDTEPARTGNATELDALGRLGGGLPQEFQVRFTASPVMRDPQVAPLVMTVGPQEQRILAEAADLLREMKPKDDVTVAGTIVALRRDLGLGPGEVVIRGVELGTGRAHRYRVLLSEDQYRLAIGAHERGLLVTARGSLVVRGTYLILEAPRQFTVQQELPQPE